MNADVQRSYDRVAEQYAAQFRDALAKKPFDRKMLDWLAEKVDDLGVICDMGCGPGQIARYLYDQGVQVCGIDLSPAMVARAQSLPPNIAFQQGDMLSLTKVAENFYGGVAAFYSIIHHPCSTTSSDCGFAGATEGVSAAREIVADISYWARDDASR